MKNAIDIFFNKQTDSESLIQQQGHMSLDAEEIKAQIVGKTFLGSFPPAFKYIILVNKDGSLEGKNNYQHYDMGKWTISAKTNTLSVSWDLGWEKSTNNVYVVDNVVKMFDTTSGKLNTSFDEQIEAVQSIKVFKI